MFGQPSPTRATNESLRAALLRRNWLPIRAGHFGILLAVAWFAIAGTTLAAERDVRLRFGWGSGNASKHRWTGSITVVGGQLSNLQVLGIEPDAPAAVYLEANVIEIAPLEKRGFDGCDVTVEADDATLVRIELQGDQATEATVFEVPLSQLADGQLSKPLDQFGSFLLAHRAPGDRLRVLPTRDSMVFSPVEQWNLRLKPDLTKELTERGVRIEIQMREIVADAPILWQANQQLARNSPLGQEVGFAITAPLKEGAYRLSISAVAEASLAGRFVPGQKPQPFAKRDVEFVVVDPQLQSLQLTDQWVSMLQIDPANPGWGKRLPAWAQLPRLGISGGAATGNVRPLVRPGPAGDWVELPANSAGDDPYWQAYPLPVRDLGAPHLVELRFPADREQNFAVSVVEPDASGRVSEPQRAAEIRVVPDANSSELVAIHRTIFWPKTHSPQLLVVNRHPSQPVEFGPIELFEQAGVAAEEVDPPPLSDERPMVAAYISLPTLVENFDAVQEFDSASGLSVPGWSTFLQAAQRLAATLRAGGYNTVVLSVASDGSALYPSEFLRPSPRYDRALLATTGVDPVRKDVLEMLLRIFDREQLRVVPTLQMACPLPRLESLRRENAGVELLGPRGTTWQATYGAVEGKAPYYNVLSPPVQSEISAVVEELTDRYGRHPSFAGIGLQLDSRGYAMLPGVEWGFDAATLASFVTARGGDSFDDLQQAAGEVMRSRRDEWIEWRATVYSNWMQNLSEQVAARRNDLQLLLLTENAFAASPLQQAVRRGLNEPVDLRGLLRESGVDLAALGQMKHLLIAEPHLLARGSTLTEQAIDQRIRTAAETGELLAEDARRGSLIHVADQSLRLASFDQRGPFDAAKTQLTLAMDSTSTPRDLRQSLARSFARPNAGGSIVGGTLMSTSIDPERKRVFKTLQQLPPSTPEVQTLTEGAVTLKIYRTPLATILAAVNTSPWPVELALPLGTETECGWVKLGVDLAALDQLGGPATGALNPGKQIWNAKLDGFDVVAWSFSDPRLRVERPKIKLDPAAKNDVAQAIADIESRSANLTIERQFLALQNPGFEVNDGTSRIVGWQALHGANGAVALETSPTHSGIGAVKISSSDLVGTALVSHLFERPETGQLLVSVFAKPIRFDPQARLFVTLEDETQGRLYQRYVVLRKDELFGDDWTRQRFAFDDIPFGEAMRLRLQFHLVGDAELLVDDVELYDLNFDERRRLNLVKRIYAAKVALEQDQVLECHDMIDDFWARYLVEYVPPKETTILRQAQADALPQAEPTPNPEPSMSERMKGWVPRIWR